MRVVADLQLHSKYSRAVSKDMVVSEIARWAELKGIDLVATGDWTHPLWFRELQASLEEVAPGLFSVRGPAGGSSHPMSSPAERGAGTRWDSLRPRHPLFLLSTEVSCIYSQGGKLRRIHILIFAPSFEIADRINQEFRKNDVNLLSDGRPIMGLTSRQVAELVLGVDERCLLIPAHCLLPDTYLEVNPGIKKIKEIENGDKVLTHKGRYKRVKEVVTRSYKGDVIRIVPWYFSLGLTTTPEHPFLAIKTFKKCRSTGDICRPVGRHLRHCTARHYEKYRRDWISADKLEVGDIILFPRIRKIKDRGYFEISRILKGLKKEKNGVSFGGYRKTVIPDKIAVDEGFLRLVGYYLAEGYVGKDDISFAFHKDELHIVSDIKLQFQRLFKISYSREYQRKDSRSIELIFHSKVVSALFSKLFYEEELPRRANRKRIPHWIIYLPPVKQKELLKGWWVGNKGYTNSQVLLNQMKGICLRLGIIPSIRVDTKEAHLQRGKHDKFDNREIQARYDTFSVEKLNFIEDKLGLSKDLVFSRFRTKLDRRHGWIDDNYAYLPVRKVEKSFYMGEVYNLEVEGDNSYTSEFATVHNCWTPWFSLYGSISGFDSIEECFGDYAKYIYAIETGLSSDPAMNWRIGELENRRIVSFSDAHSGAKLGREATVFEVPEISYEDIRKAIVGSQVPGSGLPVGQVTGQLTPGTRHLATDNRIAYTIEFYPEEGKYHLTGHRNCGVRQTPGETKKLGTTCHVCGKKLTVGVMHRVEQLAGETQNAKCKTDIDKYGIRWWRHAQDKRPAYVMMVPLPEILSEALESGVSSKKVVSEYEKLTQNLGPEFKVLLQTKAEDIEKVSGPKIREAIMKVRTGDIFIDPGYDGVFGKVKIWGEKTETEIEKELELKKKQMGLF